LKQLLIYLKDYKKESVLAPLFKMLEATFELFVPLVMAAIIDRGIAQKDNGYILKMGLVLVALGLIGLTCSITAQFFAAKAAVGFSTKMKHALFSHIQSLSFTELDTLGTSTLITRLTSDANQVQNGVNMVLRLFLRSPFIVFGAMIMAFTIDLKAALIFVVAIPLLSVVVFGIMLLTMPLYRNVQNQLDQVLGMTRENLSGARVIRAFNKEESEIAEFRDKNGRLAAMQIFVGKLSALTNPVTYIIVNGSVLALIWTGALQVDAGILTQGQVVALVNYMSQILVELVKMANLIVTITKALACADRIQSVFETKSGMQDGWKLFPADASDYAVEFDHVSLTYARAGETSLEDISFRVKKGETVGIIGGTGSGKSSLVHLIPRFYDATGGEVRVYGTNVREYQKGSLREHIGMVMQKAVLFQGSIRANLQWGKPDATDSEMQKALSAAQAADFVSDRQDGLDAHIAQAGRNLSGGQKQRLSIARALIRDPEILILDDSSSALDFATDARLRKAIRELGGAHTVFIVSQRTSSIRHADQILVMDDGRLVGCGTHEELLENCEIYQEIHYSQFPKEVQA
jgi:ABC-type multidrug transport system fused ATPase/permease subunit